MSKELIERLRYDFDDNARLEAADLIEAQQSWIASLEQNARDADRMYKELETELAASQAREKILRDALENCRLFAARRRAEEWATHILRFCESGGSVANPLRQDDSALRELLKAERERCAKVADEWQTAIHDPRYQCDCAAAIRAMEDQ